MTAVCDNRLRRQSLSTSQRVAAQIMLHRLRSLRSLVALVVVLSARNWPNQIRVARPNPEASQNHNLACLPSVLAAVRGLKQELVRAPGKTYRPHLSLRLGEKAGPSPKQRLHSECDTPAVAQPRHQDLHSVVPQLVLSTDINTVLLSVSHRRLSACRGGSGGRATSIKSSRICPSNHQNGSASTKSPLFVCWACFSSWQSSPLPSTTRFPQYKVDD
jgi:hypothetical protein